MRRITWTETATVAVSGTTSGVANISNASFGMLYIPSTFDGTTITFTVTDTMRAENTGTSTFYALKDEAGNAVSLTVAASTATPLPAELFGAAFFKIVCGTSQTTTSTIFTMTLKG